MRISGGRAYSAANIENVWVEVFHQGQKLDQAAVKNVPIPNLPQVAGLVLNKEQTPFAPLYYDRYEDIKTTR
jgi:hypothetical protein